MAMFPIDLYEFLLSKGGSRTIWRREVELAGSLYGVHRRGRVHSSAPTAERRETSLGRINGFGDGRLGDWGRPRAG